MSGAMSVVPVCRTWAGSSPPSGGNQPRRSSRWSLGPVTCSPGRWNHLLTAQCRRAISWPFQSYTLSIGLGGHHYMPPDASVAATFDNSKALSSEWTERMNPDSGASRNRPGSRCFFGS